MEVCWLNRFVLSVLTLFIVHLECACTFTVSSQLSQWMAPSRCQLYACNNEHAHGPLANPNDGEASARSVVPENIPLDVLYEDDHMMVIHKPSGMIMQFVPGSVERAVVFYLQNNSTSSAHSGAWPWKSPTSFEGIVHRIDKETSGILAVAKHPIAAAALHASFQERRVLKRYLAIARGIPTHEKLISQQAAVSTNNNNLSPLKLHAQQLAATPEQQLLSQQIKKCGRDADRVVELINQSSNPSAVNFNSAIAVCKRANEREKALAIFDSMKQRGVMPNIKCFLKVINLCAKKPTLYEKAIDLVGYMEECGLVPLNPNCVSSAISACGHAGQVEPALELLRQMMEADDQSNDFNGIVGCFESAISACERCGASSSSLDLKEQLRILVSGTSEATCENSVSAFDLQSLNKEIIVDASIGRLGSRRCLMSIQSIDQGGREARSIVTPLAFDGTLSLNSIVIETGRTHQIRVHMASMLGCPLAGDGMYNEHKSIIKGAERCMLHAAELMVPHPITGAPLKIECPPPPDFSALADTFALI